MKKDKHQRIAYAISRLTIAVARAIEATSEHEKERAMAWARLWGARGQFAPF